MKRLSLLAVVAFLFAEALTAQNIEQQKSSEISPIKWSVYTTMGISSYTSSLEPFAPEFGIRGGGTIADQIYLGGRFGFVGPVRSGSFASLNTRSEFSLSGEIGYEAQWWSIFSARFYSGVGILYSANQFQGIVNEFNADGQTINSRFFTADRRELRPFISPGILLTVTPFSPLSFGADARLAVFGSGLQGWLTFMLGLKF